MMYYELTTLSTVGYGDIFPISNNEQLFAIFFIGGGIIFFSQIMQIFLEIINNYRDKMNESDNKEAGEQLNFWMQLIIRFCDGPLPQEMVK